MTKRPVAVKSATKAAKPKVRGRPFKKGTSGNPKGKPPGTRHGLTILAETLMAADLEAVVSKMIRKAKAGDVAAGRLILDRVMPMRKGRPVVFELPAMNSVADVVGALATVTAAMAAGQLSPAEAIEIASVVELQRRAIETMQMEVRLSAIEQRMDDNE